MDWLDWGMFRWGLWIWGFMGSKWDWTGDSGEERCCPRPSSETQQEKGLGRCVPGSKVFREESNRPEGDPAPGDLPQIPPSGFISSRDSGLSPATCARSDWGICFVRRVSLIAEPSPRDWPCPFGSA